MGCDTSALRELNAGAICLLCLTSYQILRQLRPSTSSSQTVAGNPQEKPKLSDDKDPSYLFDAHSALNISLFPPLFFFTGLYYTDVLSTLIVLLSYSAFINKANGNSKFRDELLAFLLGLMSLLFRQTNIFWIAIFPAGLAVIDNLKSKSTSKATATELSTTEVLSRSWTEGLVYDASVQNATLQGIFSAKKDIDSVSNTKQTTFSFPCQWYWPQ